MFIQLISLFCNGHGVILYLELFNPFFTLLFYTQYSKIRKKCRQTKINIWNFLGVSVILITVFLLSVISLFFFWEYFEIQFCLMEKYFLELKKLLRIWISKANCTFMIHQYRQIRASFHIIYCYRVQAIVIIMSIMSLNLKE